jgi:serine/threonine protein kinase
MQGQGGVPAPGETVLDRYVVERRIGSGTSSQVFQVRDGVTGLDYALKYPMGGVSAFIEREVRFWLRLSHHRNVVSIADVRIGDDEEPAGGQQEDDDHPVILLEYVGGGTLRSRMTGQPWSVPEALAVLRDIAAGMAHASSRAEAVHLDLKPENVLFDEAGTAKVSDFGLVREVRRTKSGYPSVAPTTGTAGYQAPEIVLGTGPVDTRCDIYSFGLIAVELLTGRSMFPGDVPVAEFYRSGAAGAFAERFRDEEDPLSRLVPDYNLRVFIAGCLLPEVAERQPSFEHVLQDLWRLGAGEAPAGITQELQQRVQADAARRALSEARILYRMDEADRALEAVNRSVLFSKLDAPTRAKALGFGAWILRDLGRDEDASRLRALSERPPEADGLVLDSVPVRPGWTAEPLANQTWKAQPFDPWPPPDSKLPDPASRIGKVEGLVGHGKLASALNCIRSFLREDREFALTLASITLSRTRTQRELAIEPFEEFDDQDPWFDCLRVECDNCRTLGWASPVGSQGIPHVTGSVSPTGFSQCAACRLTLCFRCRSLWRDPGLGPKEVRCSRCGERVTFPARPTGRTRPWGHDLRAAPVECVLIHRAGVLTFSPDWARDLFLHLSPDLYLTGRSVYGGYAGAVEGVDLLGSTVGNIRALMNAGQLAPDAPDRTEGLCGTDADGVPFAMLKVMLSAAARDVTIGLLFNIDRLGSAWYGPEAYKILFRHLDPKRLAGCRFSDGDTSRTLSSMTREYCIGIEAPAPGAVAYIRATMSQCPEPALLLGDARFLEWAAVTQEPLAVAGTISDAGTLVVPANGMLRASHADGTAWRIQESAADTRA